MKKIDIVDVAKDEATSFIKDEITKYAKWLVNNTLVSMIVGAAVPVSLEKLKSIILSSSEVPPSLIKKSRSRFLNEDPEYAVKQYSAEQTIAPNIPYVELANFSNLLAKGKKPKIELDIKRGKFELESWDDHETEWLVEAGSGALRAENRVTHDSAVVRVSDVKPTEDGAVFTIQEARYSQQARSNLILDFDELPHGRKSSKSIRDQLLRKYGSKLPPLSESHLVNSLGCAVLVFYEFEGRLVPLQVMRTVDTAVFNGGGWHCTASGAAEWPTDPARTDNSFQAYIEDDIYEELRVEVGFPPHSVRLELVAVCRELARGGKPQLFFIGFSDAAPEKIAKQMETARLKQIEARKNNPFAEPIEVQRHPFMHEAKSFSSKDEVDGSATKFGFTPEAAACLYYFFDMINAAESEERRTSR